MIGLIWFVLAVLASLFKSKSRLEAENAVLRHQLIVLRRRVRGRIQPTDSDRWFLVQMYRWFPSILTVVTIVRPETLVRWHRAGFRRYWRWKSNLRGGRPRIEMELRALIRRMSTENQLWGAPRIHGELLKLGFSVAQSSVAKYMVKRRGPPSQGWRVLRHFLGTNLRTTSSAIGIKSMALLSRADCAPWASGTSRLHQPRLGRTALPNGWSDRSGASVLTISSSWARRICAESCDPMLTITTTFEHIGHWIKMRQSLARFSGPESSPQIRSLADFIATTSGFSFSVHTARRAMT
jgi:hypothetical protein